MNNDHYLHIKDLNNEIMKRLPISDLIKFAYDPQGPPLRQEIYNNFAFWYDKSVAEFHVKSPQLTYDWRQIYHFISKVKDFNPNRLKLEDLNLESSSTVFLHDDVVRYYLAGPFVYETVDILEVRPLSIIRLLLDSNIFDLDFDLLLSAVQENNPNLVEEFITRFPDSVIGNGFDLISLALDENSGRAMEVLLRKVTFNSDKVMAYILEDLNGIEGNEIRGHSTLNIILKDPQLHVEYNDNELFTRLDLSKRRNVKSLLKNPNFHLITQSSKPLEIIKKMFKRTGYRLKNGISIILADSRLIPFIKNGQLLKLIPVRINESRDLIQFILRKEIEYGEYNQHSINVAFFHDLLEFQIFARNPEFMKNIDPNEVLKSIAGYDSSDLQMRINNLKILLLLGADPNMVDINNIIYSHEILQIFLSNSRFNPAKDDNALIAIALTMASAKVVKMLLADPRIVPTNHMFQEGIIRSPELIPIIKKDGRFNFLRCHGKVLFDLTAQGDTTKIISFLGGQLNDQKNDPYMLDIAGEIEKDETKLLSYDEIEMLIEPWLECED